LDSQVKEDGAAAMCGKYPSDVTDRQWRILVKLLARRGRPPIDRRRALNAVLCRNRTGCQWRCLPHDFPKWKTVYTNFRRWRLVGLWQPLHDALVRMVRKAAGKIQRPRRRSSTVNRFARPKEAKNEVTMRER
jgi:transposase